MRGKSNNKRVWAGSHLWRIGFIMLGCFVIYYLPSIAGLAGWTSGQNTLIILHNFYGLDFYALVFFIPVVYAAYTLGVIGAVAVALVVMVLLLPYAMILDSHPNALFRPTAFVLILSAVGAVVAMLQKGDEQRRRSMNELKCLYDIGRAADENSGVDSFLSSVAELIPRTLKNHEKTQVRIVVRDKVFQTQDFENSKSGTIMEDLVVGGEALGTVELYSNGGRAYQKKQENFFRTMVERIGGAVREIELEHSLEGYYEQLEEEVEKRTKDLEEAQEKLIRSERLAAVGELASGVGHELRNPLNVIRNCAYLLNMMLESGKADEEMFNTLKLLDQQVDISNRIVSDLLNFTRVRKPSPSRIDINGLIKESLSWVTVPEDISVVEDLAVDSMQTMVDVEQVGRAFANIIANAVQSMKGKGELRLGTGIEDDCVWIKVEDTGCGISEENLSKIFEPLFTTKPRGIGLGLAITKRLVEQNSGHIEVTSRVNEGTAFVIRLPLEKKEAKVA